MARARIYGLGGLRVPCETAVIDFTRRSHRTLSVRNDIETSARYLPTFHTDRRRPSLFGFAPRDALHAALVGRGNSHVVIVLGRAGAAQIEDAVVELVAVDVVDHGRWLNREEQLGDKPGAQVIPTVNAFSALICDIVLVPAGTR